MKSNLRIHGTAYHFYLIRKAEAGNPNGVDMQHGGPDGWEWGSWTTASLADVGLLGHMRLSMEGRNKFCIMTCLNQCCKKRLYN